MNEHNTESGDLGFDDPRFREPWNPHADGRTHGWWQDDRTGEWHFDVRKKQWEDEEEEAEREREQRDREASWSREEDVRVRARVSAEARLRDKRDDASESTLSFTLEKPSELLAIGGEDVDWLAPGMIVRGQMTALGSLPKKGKTEFMFGMVKAANTSGVFLGRECTPFRTLYLTEEGRSLQRTLKRWGIRDEWVTIIRRPAVQGLSMKTWEAFIERIALEVAGGAYDLVVFDTYQEWPGLEGSSENDAETPLQILKPLRVLTEAGVAVLVCAHHRKAEGEHGTRFKGNVAFNGKFDIMLELEPLKVGDEADGERILKGDNSRYQGEPGAIPATLRIRRVLGEGYDVVNTDGRVKQAALIFLGGVKDHEGWIGQDAALKGVHKLVPPCKDGVIVAALRELLEDGHVEHLARANTERLAILERVGLHPKCEPWRIASPNPALPPPLRSEGLRALDLGDPDVVLEDLQPERLPEDQEAEVERLRQLAEGA
jgi:hypothetical protein